MPPEHRASRLRKLPAAPQRTTQPRGRAIPGTAWAGLVAASLLGSGAACNRVDDPSSLVSALATAAGGAEVRSAARRLVEGGTASIPALVGGLRDTRPLRGLPAASPWRDSLSPAVAGDASTVGELCERLLYEIVTPRLSAGPREDEIAEARGVLEVVDWVDWWEQNRGRDLAAIHDAAEAALHAWRSGLGPASSEPAGATPDTAANIRIPAGSRAIPALGGATTLGPGRNHVVRVWEVARDLPPVAAFYRRVLPAASVSSDGADTVFTIEGASVRLTRLAGITRITVTTGPR